MHGCYHVSGDGSISHKFNGKERGPETATAQGGLNGLDNFEARNMTSRLGRFMSPDWSEDPDPVPYADPSDPQSLNLYAYTDNNPISSIDYDGHDPCPASQGLATGFGCGAIEDALPALNRSLINRLVSLLFGGGAGQTPDPQTQSQGWSPSPGPAPSSKPRVSMTNAAPIGFAGAVAIPAAAGSELGPFDAIVIAGAAGVYLYKNKDAEQQAMSRILEAVRHISLLNHDPGKDPRNHWRKEIRDRLAEARKWANRISNGARKRSIIALIEQVERAVPLD
ncbi:MAG TPA: RHS repeat-associated core domain-containing protein [Candidatus Acidoferrum sp.]|nr:RHS repeat-associated core domain-containing protein [Candidatus Acidoferrum sp.]